MTVGRPLLAALLALGLSGCGAQSADLFAVERSGVGAGAGLRLVVADEGTVRCNDRPATPLESERLLEARELARDLETPAALGLELPEEKDSTFQYTVRHEDGTVKFADNSRGKPEVLVKVAAFTRLVAKGDCGLER